jgi:hypothetical protein
MILPEQDKIRRIASNKVFLNNEFIGRNVVEMRGKEVFRYFPLNEELASTEWTVDEIHIINIGGCLTIEL